MSEVAPTVEGVALGLRVERIVLSLEELERRARKRPSTVRPPRIAVPELSGRFKLRPMRLFALRELLGLAWSLEARASIPLVPTKLRKGLFSIEIPEETALVIDVGVHEAHIKFDGERTRGVIEPAIRLPLGLSFRGVNIKEDGTVVADISKLPIGIGWIRFRRLRIPASLKEINTLLEAREESDDADDEGGVSLPLDYSSMSVHARDVVPRSGPLPLGEAGVIEFLERTRVDVDYTEDLLRVHGHLAAHADLSGFGFITRNVAVDAVASAELRRPRGDTGGTEVVVSCERATAAEVAVTLLDGSLFELRDVEARQVDVVAESSEHEDNWRVACESLSAHLASGVFILWIGGRAHELHIGETDIAGSVVVTDAGYELDLEIEGAVLTMSELRIELGVADLTFRELHARATGRLRINSEGGADFAGVLSLDAELAEGWVWVGPLRAHLVGGSSMALNVTHIAGGGTGAAAGDGAGREGLEVLEGSGTVEIQLASGSVPLTGDAQLSFSRGATGTVAVHTFSLARGQRWPTIEAGVNLQARSDVVEFPGSLLLPSGVTSLEVARIDVDTSGALSLGEIVVRTTSDDAIDAHADANDAVVSTENL